MAAAGDDLSKARDIDFNHVFAKEEQAQLFACAVQQLGCARISCHFFEEKNLWDVRVVVFMPPDHEQLSRTEQKFDTMAREFLGRSDGWGCFKSM